MGEVHQSKRRGYQMHSRRQFLKALAMAAVSRPAPSPLPDKIVAAWHWAFTTPPTLASVMTAAPQYNHASWAVAVGDGGKGGGVTVSTVVQVSDIKAWKASGRSIVLLVGSWEDRGLVLLNLTHVRQFVSSIIPLIDSCGFQGIDWDLEHGSMQWAPAMMATASRRLRAHYGSDFIIAASPRPFEINGPDQLYMQFVADFGLANIDLIQPQFYGRAGQDDAWFLHDYIAWDLEVMINMLGVPASKILLGCSDVSAGLGAPGSPATYTAAYGKACAGGKDIRGAIFWNDMEDQKNGWTFAHQMSEAIRRI